MRRSRPTEVEVPVTPMLDMAFQLLTFFILTYQPAPVEGQFTMNLLPAAPAIDMSTEPPQEAPEEAVDPSVPAALRTMFTTLHANPDGSLARVTMGELTFETLDQLRSKLKEIVSNDTLPFDQAVIEADPDLSYSEVIRVIDVFVSPEIDITKISFAERSASDEEGSSP